MRRVPVLLISLAALFPSLSAQTPPVVRVMAVTPEPANRLASGQNLYVRVAYASDQPLRFQAAGYQEGKKHDGLALNPSPVYRAGEGEALVWLFGQAGAHINEVRVVVYDTKWKPLLEVFVPVQTEWHAGLSAAPVAPWAEELIAAQQRAMNEAMKQEPAPTSLFDKIWFALTAPLVPLAFLCVPGYPLLQAYALWKLHGPARLLSALPLSFMLPAYAFSLYALSQDSNLWPLAAIFASPVAFVITLVVFLLARKQAKALAAA